MARGDGAREAGALVQLDAAPALARARTSGVSAVTARRAVSRVQHAAVPRLEAAGAAALGEG